MEQDIAPVAPGILDEADRIAIGADPEIAQPAGSGGNRFRSAGKDQAFAAAPPSRVSLSARVNCSQVEKSSETMNSARRTANQGDVYTWSSASVRERVARKGWSSAHRSMPAGESRNRWGKR